MPALCVPGVGGFSPVIQQIKNNFAQQIGFRLVLGPFRVDATAAMSDALRTYVLEQWHKVQQTTTQPFDFTFQMGDDFVYDTLPACRAIKSFVRQHPVYEMEFLHAIQAAFYIKNSNVTREDVLIELAEKHQANTNLFIQGLHCNATITALHEDFGYDVQLGIQGYPALIGIHNGQATMLANGFLPYTSLELTVKQWSAAN